MVFTVNRPLQGHDEDAPAYADDKLLIVCDGLGGGGQNSYLIDGKKRTSAYLGSRKVSLACQEYLLAHYDEFCRNMKNPKSLIAGLKSHISKSLDEYVSDKGLKNIVRGKSMQMLPSTLAAILYKSDKEHTEVLVISAGDSRAYILTPDKGLQQISKDDVFDEVDAFDKSATMTNNIRQDGDYHINYAYYSLPPECILLACTDGCFDYISNPMELEYRLEYSISKCGELLDTEKNALGEYFGDILVKSGLKDDCTLAGTIIGYMDSEKTKSFFLKRALYIQEKYRNPCVLCDKESIKRKNETSIKIPDIENKICSLKKDMDDSIKKIILDAFILENQNMVGGFASDAHKEILHFLKGFEIYQSFIDELTKEEIERKKNVEDKDVEYLDIRLHLQQLFKSMRFEEFVNNLLGFSMSRILNPDRRIYAEEYKRLRKMTEEVEQKYIKALADFSKVFEEFKLIPPNMQDNVNKFAPSSIKFSELQVAYNEYISLKHDFQRCENNLKSFYMEDDADIEREFINAWRRGFSAYSRYPQYAELRSGYDRCMELKQEKESYRDLTCQEKTQKFKDYLDEHSVEFLRGIKDNTYLLRLICKDKIDDINSLEKQLNELKQYSSEFDEKKYALWMEYKPIYELYNHCIGGKV